MIRTLEQSLEEALSAVHKLLEQDSSKNMPLLSLTTSFVQFRESDC